MTVPEDLIRHDGDPHRVSFEARIAYEWEAPLNTLGARHGRHRDRVVLRWLADAVQENRGTVLDIGSAYGNHLFMLNAYLGKQPQVELHGVELDEKSLAFAQAFAESVPGYANCRFAHGDVSEGLSYGDETFDAVNLADVLEHLESPVVALREIHRVLRPGGTLVVSTPLRDSMFKRVAAALDRRTSGSLYRAYYRGKDTELDQRGQPVMDTRAGLDHVSEMTYEQLLQAVADAGFSLEDVEVMSVMSGSEWFDKHPALLAVLLLIESVHLRLRRPRWGHSACLRLIRA
jgi:SAM-dependent methyltransferase